MVSFLDFAKQKFDELQQGAANHTLPTAPGPNIPEMVLAALHKGDQIGNTLMGAAGAFGAEHPAVPTDPQDAALRAAWRNTPGNVFERAQATGEEVHRQNQFLGFLGQQVLNPINYLTLGGNAILGATEKAREAAVAAGGTRAALGGLLHGGNELLNVPVEAGRMAYGALPNALTQGLVRAGIGGAAGGAAGGLFGPAETPEDRLRNALGGAAIGASVGVGAPGAARLGGRALASGAQQISDQFAFGSRNRAVEAILADPLRFADEVGAAVSDAGGASAGALPPRPPIAFPGVTPGSPLDNYVKRSRFMDNITNRADALQAMPDGGAAAMQQLPERFALPPTNFDEPLNRLADWRNVPGKGQVPESRALTVPQPIPMGAGSPLPQAPELLGLTPAARPEAPTYLTSRDAAAAIAQAGDQHVNAMIDTLNQAHYGDSPFQRQANDRSFAGDREGLLSYLLQRLVQVPQHHKGVDPLENLYAQAETDPYALRALTISGRFPPVEGGVDALRPAKVAVEQAAPVPDVAPPAETVDAAPTALTPPDVAAPPVAQEAAQQATGATYDDAANLVRTGERGMGPYVPPASFFEKRFQVPIQTAQEWVARMEADPTLVAGRDQAGELVRAASVPERAAASPTTDAAGGQSLVAPAITSGIGGAVGAGIGAATSENPEDRGRNAAAGAALGAGIGFTLPAAAASQFGHALSADPEHLRLILSEAYNAMKLERPGMKPEDFLKEFGHAWRSQAVLSLKNHELDVFTILGKMKEYGKEAGVTPGDVIAAKDWKVQHYNDPDLLNRLAPETQTILRDLGYVDDQTGQLALDLGQMLGTGAMQETMQYSTAARGGGRFLMGAAASLANPRSVKVAPLAPLIGGIRGYFAPAFDAGFKALNLPIQDAGRETFFAGKTINTLGESAQQFLDGLAQRGIDVSGLPSTGLFGPDDIKAVVLGQTRDGNLATQLAHEWRALTDATIEAAAARTSHIFLNYNNSNKATRFISAVSPFTSYNVKSLPIMAETMARHPLATYHGLEAIGASRDAVQANKEQSYNTGTIPFGSDLPGPLGELVRGRLAGKEGTARANPISNFVPVQPDIATLPDGPTGNPTFFQRYRELSQKGGLPVHPLAQAAAYVTGQDYMAGMPLTRLSGIENASGMLTDRLNIPFLPKSLPSGGLALDALRGAVAPKVDKALQTQGIFNTSSGPQPDSFMRRYGELVLEQTGKPLSDPTNIAYVRAQGRADNALWQQAKDDTRSQDAVNTAIGFVSPVTTTVMGKTAGEAITARQGLPVSGIDLGLLEQRAGIKGRLDEASALVRNGLLHPQSLTPTQRTALAAYEQNQQYKRDNPAAATYDITTPKARQDALLADWDRQHAGLKFAAPSIWQRMRDQYAQELTWQQRTDAMSP